MKNFLNNGTIKISSENYLKLLIIIVPLLNFLSGFTVDLYTPSMPALAHYFSSPIALIKNTVTVTLIGFSIGAFLNGIFLDVFGRRRIILLGLILYIIASIAAIFCHSISQLLVIRFIQGFLASAFTIGCRTIVVDIFHGHQFNVAMLYTSLAYGVGPIIGPFIGGILQHHLGWKANFIAYGVMGFVFLLLYALFVNESLRKQHSFSLRRLFNSYKDLLTHRIFLAAIGLWVCCQIQLTLYAMVGAFIVQDLLHHTAIVFGNTALLVGLCYFLGIFTNRFLIKKFHVTHLTHAGLILLIISTITQILFAIFGKFDLLNLVLPIMMMGYCLGIIFPTFSIRCLKIFPQYAGVATSVLIAFGVGIASIGMFFISFVSIDDLLRLSMIYATVLIFQLIIFYGFYNSKDQTFPQ